MTATFRLSIAVALLAFLGGCSGSLHESPTTNPAPSCEVTTSTLSGTVVLEEGEHNLTAAGGSMASGSYQDFPWHVPLGSPSRVEVVADWQPGPGAETLQVEVGSGRASDLVVARGPSPLNFSFTPTPELESLRVLVRPSADPIAGVGVAVLPQAVEVRLVVRQSNLCPDSPAHP